MVAYILAVWHDETDRTVLELDDEKKMWKVTIEADSGVPKFADHIWKLLTKVKLRFWLRWQPGGPVVIRLEPLDPKCKEAHFFPAPQKGLF